MPTSSWQPIRSSSVRVILYRYSNSIKLNFLYSFYTKLTHVEQLVYMSFKKEAQQIFQINSTLSAKWKK